MLQRNNFRKNTKQKNKGDALILYNLQKKKKSFGVVVSFIKKTFKNLLSNKSCKHVSTKMLF